MVLERPKRLDFFKRVEFLVNTKKLLTSDSHVKQEVASAKRSGMLLSLIIFEIDFFDIVVEECGESTAKTVSKEIVFLVKAAIRTNDIFMHWKNDKFIILLPEINCVSSQLTAEKLRRNIAGFTFTRKKIITCSFGVTQLDPNDSYDDFINRATDALHNAKHKGCDRVVTQ